MGILLFELFRNPLFMGILNKWETLVRKRTAANTGYGVGDGDGLQRFAF